jgi:hypothetical protein
MMKRREIREGMVFSVPLRSGRFALGVVTRHAKSAVTVGCFFGPPLDAVPAVVPDLRPEDSVLVARFGDIPLVDEEWTVIGSLPHWERSAWPSDHFVRGDMRGRGYLVRYDENDPSVVVVRDRLSELLDTP